MRKTFVLFLAAAALALVAVGCGEDEDEAAAEGNAPAETMRDDAPAQEAAPGGEDDIVTLAQATPELATLVDAVTAAKLTGTLQAEGPFTVFAPTNDAFAQVEGLDELLKPRSRDQLADVLTYHVVPGRVMAADLEDGQTVETVQGDTLEVAVNGDSVRVNGARVVMADVEASNGVVHVIDEVLLPGS